MGSLLDYMEGAVRKRDGMNKAATSRADLLKVARDIATVIAIGRGWVSIDEVRQRLVDEGFPDSLGPAAGSVFAGKDWEAFSRKRSSIPSNHRRWITMWRLR